MAKDNPITKLTRRFFERKNLLPDKDGSIPTGTSVNRELEQNTKLLANCANMYGSLLRMRQERQINWDYYHGDQFNELIPNPDGCGVISEKEYIIKQGYIPLSINIILPKIKALVGVYRGQSMEPFVISRVRDEQKLGELLTNTMLYAYSAKDLYEEYMKGYKEYKVSAIACFRTGYGWDKKRKIEEVYANLMDINDMFWSYNNNDSFFDHVHTIGCLHDMTFGEILSEYATNDTEIAGITKAYQENITEWENTDEQFANLDKDVYKSFYYPAHVGQCRVIEVWKEEYHYVYPCWDTGKGESFTLPYTPESKAWIDAENQKRIAEVVAAGGQPEDAALIEVGYFDEQTGKRKEFRVDIDWVGRHMTPSGYVLRTEVSPFLHGSHPFVIGAFPLTNGEIHSDVSDLRNSQRMINRLLSSAEFERMNRAKGAIVVNREVLERSGISETEFAKKYTDPKGVISLIRKDDEWLVERLADKTGNLDDDNKMQLYLNIANEVSGTQGTLQGEKPSAGTPAALYAQRTENANNNIADGMEWYNSLINRVNHKLLMLQLQHYDKRRFIEIAGKEFIHEIEYIVNTPARQRQILFDLQLIKSPQNGFARIQRETMLQTMFERGAIPAEIWLRNSSANGADKIAEELEQYKQEQAAMQQDAAAAAAQQQALQAAQDGMPVQPSMPPTQPAPPMG